jgi:hypothetical protein
LEVKERVSKSSYNAIDNGLIAHLFTKVVEGEVRSNLRKKVFRKELTLIPSELCFLCL